MLFLHKLLPMFVLPLGWVVLLILLGLLFRRRVLILVALLILYISSLSFTGERLVRSIESKFPPLDFASLPTVDAIVPLGGILGPTVEKGKFLNVGEANERLEAGITLWQRKKGKWLVFTGGRIPWVKEVNSEGVECRRHAEGRGVPAESIVVTEEVGNTADEARVIGQEMRKRGWKKILLITSAWHMPRAAQHFQRAGVNFMPVAVDYLTGKANSPTVLDFLPSANGLRLTELALREWYGIAYYALFR